MIDVYIHFSNLRTSLSCLWQSRKGCKNDTVGDSSRQSGRAAVSILMKYGMERTILITLRL